MYSTKVHNLAEVVACLEKLGRRKGKPTALAAVPSGSLIRWENGPTLLYYKRDDLGWAIYPAWAYLLSQLCVGSGSRNPDAIDKPVRLIAGPDEIVQPDAESALLTQVTHTPDGLYHCQNYIYGLPGQHFVTAEVPDDRPTDVSEGTCDCGLELGQCREYDGRVWKKEPPACPVHQPPTTTPAVTTPPVESGFTSECSKSKTA